MFSGSVDLISLFLGIQKERGNFTNTIYNSACIKITEWVSKSTENKCSHVVGALSHPDNEEDDAEKNPGWREGKDDGENGLHCQADKQHDFSAISEEHTSTGDACEEGQRVLSTL